MVRRLSIVVLALALAAGCKRRSTGEEEAKKVTASSTDDATEDLVDEDYRFRLAWPGTGWKVLREKDARHTNPDAVGGLSNANSVNAMVIVEHMPGVELAAFTDVILENMALEDKQFDKSPTKVSGIPAMRIKATGKYNDLSVEFRGFILVHQDHAYQMLAFAPIGLGKPGDLDKAIAAFSIEPGTVKTRAASTEVDDQAGVGWRVAKGVFESAAGRLRVRPTEGWGLAVGDELYKMNPDAVVAVINVKLGAYTTAITEMVPGAGDQKSYIAGRIDQVMSTLTRVDKPARAKIIGKDVELARGRLEGGVPLEYLIGVVVDGGRGYQFIAWYSEAQRAVAEPAVLAAFAAFELMSAADVEKLSTELTAAPDPQNLVGATYTLRGGTYYDFAKQLRWRKPPGFWKIVAGQDARATNADALLSGEEVVRGLQMELIVEPANQFTPKEFYGAIESNLARAGVAVDRKDETTLSSKKARLFEGKLAAPGLSLRYRSTAGIVGGLAIQLNVWGPEGVWPDDASIGALTGGVEVVPSLVDIEPGSQFRNHRLGYEVGLPSGWRREDTTPAPMKAVASMHQWRSGRDQILVVAIYTLETDDAWLIDLVEQIMRQTFAKQAIGTPKTATAKLAGRDARHLIWDAVDGRVDLMMLKRAATFYGVLAINQDRSKSTIDTARAAFSLLR